MQNIAAQNNLSETAFFVPRGGDYELRWFTPKVEIDLCGHATLASAFVLFSELGFGEDAICFHSHAAVEKLLKALIVSRGTFPPRTHELPDLLELQPSEIRANQTLVLACKLLAELYPKSRYPDAGEPTPDEARSAIAAAAAARTVLLDWLPARE